MRLLTIPYPLQDESFYSYALRASIENGYENTLDVYRTLGLSPRKMSKLRRYRINSLTTEDIIRLKMKKYLGPQVMAKGSFLIEHVGTSSLSFDFEINSVRFPNMLVNKNYFKICPYCMKSNPFLRNAWFIMPITSCPLHNILLLDCCSICQRKFQLNKGILKGCSNCSATWEEIAENLPKHVIDVDSTLSNLIRNKLKISSKPSEHKISTEFLKLDVGNMVAILALIAWVLPNEKPFSRIYLVEQETNYQTHVLLSKALDVFSDWPNSFYTFLESLLSIKKYHNPRLNALRTDNQQVRGRRDLFGELFKKLREEFTHPDAGFMNNVLTNFLTEKYPHELKRYSQKQGLLHSNAKEYVSATEVVLKYGIRFDNIRKFLLNGYLEGTIKTRNDTEFLLITQDSVEALVNLQKQSLSTSEVCEFLGFKKSQTRHVFELLELGFIKAVRGPNIDGHGWLRFDRKSIEELLLTFEQNLKRKTASSIDFENSTGPLLSYYCCRLKITSNSWLDCLSGIC